MRDGAHIEFLGVRPAEEDFAERDLIQRQHADRRRKWVEKNAPHVDEGDPVHTIYIAAFQGDFELEELDTDGAVCAVASPKVGDRCSAPRRMSFHERPNSLSTIRGL